MDINDDSRSAIASLTSNAQYDVLLNHLKALFNSSVGFSIANSREGKSPDFYNGEASAYNNLFGLLAQLKDEILEKPEDDLVKT